MNNFRYRMQRFMAGRNGADRLFYILTIAYVALMFLNVFLHSMILYFVGIGIFAAAAFRYFSRNTAKRQRENAKAEQAYYSAAAKVNKMKTRREQSRTYFFKRCPNCGKTLRLPRVKGKHGTKCPACGCKFSVRIIKGAKN